jgi:hypothetical protein
MAQFAVSDLEYDIITTMSNLLQGREALTKYKQDAQQAGDDETAQLFEQLASFNNEMAGKFRDRLRQTNS